MAIKVGTAGWSLSRGEIDHFPAEGTALERYSARFPVVEINSSFHRPHRETTWSRWRDTVPETFRFSVKLPKEITHQRKLHDCDELLDLFLDQVGHLGEKLSVLLMQLPPKLEFDPRACGRFLDHLKQKAKATIVCEPRHPSWFTSPADSLLTEFGVARAAADPAVTGCASIPGGADAVRYFRLHGSPVIYRSSYADRIEAISAMVQSSRGRAADVWCIFDNTASSAAVGNALELQAATSGIGAP